MVFEMGRRGILKRQVGEGSHRAKRGRNSNSEQRKFGVERGIRGTNWISQIINLEGGAPVCLSVRFGGGYQQFLRGCGKGKQKGILKKRYKKKTVLAGYTQKQGKGRKIGGEYCVNNTMVLYRGA